MSDSHASDAPPSYEAATGSSPAPTPGIRRVSTDGPASRTARNGIPPEDRRSMEDENRPLPEGWVRTFDPAAGHQFFVDTGADPPRSTWLHPYDDPEYLATLSPEERKTHARMHHTMSLEDVAAESSDDEGGAHHAPRVTAGSSQLPPRDEAAPTGIHKFTRKMKDKVTSSTHEERQEQRRQREEQERRAYAAHLRTRQAMIRAMETGQPQFLWKDRDGRDVYIMAPGGPGAPSGAYGYNPYARNGPYYNTQARYVRPVGPYGRQYGYGYGGGIGAPVAAGFLGGALLGGLLF